MKQIIALFFSLLISSMAQANTIEMFGKEKYGFDVPRYAPEETLDVRGTKLVIIAIGDDNNFPVSSFEQGSVFSNVFRNLKEEYNIKIIIQPLEKNYEESVQRLERGGSVAGPIDHTGYIINGIFGSAYKERPYSRNKDIYPAFFVNNIHILTSAQNKIELKDKKDLKGYKGIYAKTDRIADNIINDFINLDIKEVETLPEAFEQLLTGKVDYIAASYYPSLLETYKLGIRDYVVYSKAPVWKMPLFIRVHPSVMKNKKIEELERYLRSPQYKKAVKDVLDDLVETYQKNTAGIVPPTYTKEEETIENSEMEDKAFVDEQKLEN